MDRDTTIYSKMAHTQHPQRAVAIVTGAGSGVGRASAIVLASAGFQLVLAGRRSSRLTETGTLLHIDQDSWHAVETDIARSEDRQELIDETIRRFGRIDVIVNNAAVGTCNELGKLSEDEVIQLFEINAIGPVDFVRRALPELIKSEGCVINIASVAMIDPFVGLGAYGCTKAAIDGLTRAIHNEYHEQGVKAYTIAPGAVETDMLRSIVSKEILPCEHTLSPKQIAMKILECATNQAQVSSGSTIVINSD